MSGVRAVLFDGFGTLLGRHPEEKREWELGALRRAVGAVESGVALPPAEALLDAWRATEGADPAVALERALVRLGATARVARRASKPMAERHFLELSAGIRLLPDAREALFALPDKVKVALVTNYPHAESLCAALDRLGVFYRFDAVVVSSEAGARKPDPAIFERALAEVDAEAADAIMVGDGVEDDLAPAKALGMRTVRVAWPRGEAPAAGGAVDFGIADLAALAGVPLWRGEGATER